MRIRFVQIMLIATCTLMHFLSATTVDNPYPEMNRSVPFSTAIRTHCQTPASPEQFTRTFLHPSTNFLTAAHSPFTRTFLASTTFLTESLGPIPPERKSPTTYSRYQSPVTNDDSRVLTDFTVVSGEINPFTSSFLIRFTLRKPERVQILVYNQTGKMVRQLTDGVFPAGPSLVQWYTASDPGDLLLRDVYLVVIQTPHYRIVRRITLLR